MFACGTSSNTWCTCQCRRLSGLAPSLLCHAFNFPYQGLPHLLLLDHHLLRLLLVPSPSSASLQKRWVFQHISRLIGLLHALSRTYLAHHELESVIIINIIMPVRVTSTPAQYCICDTSWYYKRSTQHGIACSGCGVKMGHPW